MKNWEKEMIKAEGTLDLNKVIQIGDKTALNQTILNQTIDKYHLAELITSLIREGRPELVLPDNLYTITSLQGWTWSHRSRVPAEVAQTLPKQIRCFCGWLKALPRFKWLRPSRRGTQSPYEPSWWAIFERHPSPGAIPRFIEHAYRTACRVLGPYGIKPVKLTRGFRHTTKVGATLLARGSKNARKAGYQWAAWTISMMAGEAYYGFPKSYKHARSILMCFALNKVGNPKQRARVAIAQCDGDTWSLWNWRQDHTDGVTSIVSDPIFEYHGVKITVYITEDGHYGLLARMGQWSYHEGGSFYNHPPNLKNRCKTAIKKWKQQRAAAAKISRKEEELLASLHPQGEAEVVVLYADSMQAGNCHIGTMEWVKNNVPGFRYAAPYKKVASLAATDYRVQNVLNMVLR